MNGRKLLEKWKRRIERCQLGDGQAIRQVVIAASDELDRRRRCMSPAEYIEVTVKLVAVASMRSDPDMTPGQLQALMLQAWDELAIEDLAACN